MTRESIDHFYRSYFAQWRPEFQVYADVQYRWTIGPEAAIGWRRRCAIAWGISPN